MINRKISLAQVGEMGRIYVDYDVRRVGGEGLQLRVYRPDQDLSGIPLRQWTFDKSSGRERISFNDLPIAVYLAYAVAVDTEGKAVAAVTPIPVHIEYGGWRAWAAYEQPKNADLRSKPPPFEGLIPGRDSGKVSAILPRPSSLVVNPGEQAEVDVDVVALPPEEELDWELNGEGDLEVLGARKVRYTAPEQVAENQVARLSIKGRMRPDVTATVVILITNIKKGEIQLPGEK